MSIEFDIDQNEQDTYYSRSVLGEDKIPGMAVLLQKKGIVSTPDQGKKILVFVTVLFFIISIVLFVRLFIGGGEELEDLPLEVRLELEREGL